MSWSEPAHSLYGYDASDIVGEDFAVLFDDAGGLDADVGELLAEAETGVREFEHQHRRADGTSFRATGVLSPLAVDGVEGYVIAVSKDTAAKTEYERMLERQNDQLKQFTDIVAHDLRNPLQSLRTRLGLYWEDDDERHIEHVEETIERMDRLVADLLRVAQQGGVVTDPELIDPEPVVETAWECTGDDGQPTLSYEAIPSVAADADRLCQLFENLFRNAVEHGGTGVTVRVGPLRDGFFVEDDGSGIPSELREEVFDHGMTTTAAGGGYGLSVVQTVAAVHGWDVCVTESDAGGARFEVTGVGSPAAPKR